MWEKIKAKVNQLSALDKTRQVFGARTHQYQFGAKLSEDYLSKQEETLGFTLPENLRSFYSECGDGGAGPYYGVRPLAEVTYYNAEKPFRSPEVLRNRAMTHPTTNNDDSDYFYDSEQYWSVPVEEYQGLMSIINFGCGGEICVVTNGEHKGCSVFKDFDTGLTEWRSLHDDFNHWLDKELEYFRVVISLMDECNSAEEIARICSEKYRFVAARDYMVSYLGIPKPANLFGANENRFHGAVQFPWYEKQFAKSQKKKHKKFWFF